VTDGSPDTGLRIRRDVQSLIAEGDAGLQVLDDYGAAIIAMKELDSAAGPPRNPRSWRFQAAIHGLTGLRPSIDHPQHWASCRHNSWFFLPWHRMYLYCFERIVQSHLGDDSWALPYWDYTKASASSRILPAPFRTPATGNPLHVAERDLRINHESAPEPLDAEEADAMPALRIDTFALPAQNAASSFGGGVVEDVVPTARARGSVELQPHGLVHGAVGGEDPPGFMSRFETAALDPIFWLHHSNIDRLWDVWLRRWGVDALPDATAWLDTEYEFFDADGNRTKRTIRALLDSAELGYAYESTDPPRPIPVQPGPEGLALAFPEEEALVPMADPELVGATEDVPFAERVEVGIELARPPEAVLAAAAITEPTRWFLRVEDVVGEHPAVSRYDVYLNLPAGHRAADHPELRAGSIATFGIPEASQPQAEHGGLGLTDVFEVTDVMAALRDDFSWDGSTLHVTVVPAGVGGEAERGGDVRAGRISIYAG
jgi:tyrosinase